MSVRCLEILVAKARRGGLLIVLESSIAVVIIAFWTRLGCQCA